jgi:hypothetical protein
MGVIRLLARDFGIPVAHAAELADQVLRHTPETRALPLAVSNDGAATLVIDLARYHSTFVAALSAAVIHGGARQRGRPLSKRSRRRDPLAVARHHGVDVSLLRESIDRSPAERLARLDANASFLNALRPVPRRRSPRRAS